MPISSPAPACEYVQLQTVGCLGLVTLNRPAALNALSLGMVRALTAQLIAWRSDEKISAVLIRGSDKNGPFGHFCAGGDIRFLYEAAHMGDMRGDDFFTEEYALNHLIYTYPKPYIAFMDGIVMGGGMGISQGARLRLVTQNTRMAMPETIIGLVTDAGGGYFLSRCPGHTGEWLGLTGQSIGAEVALELGLADVGMDAAQLPALWGALQQQHSTFDTPAAVTRFVRTFAQQHPLPQPAASVELPRALIDQVFGLPSVQAIVHTLEAQAQADPSAHVWQQQTAAMLRQRSPLMLHVALEHIRRGRYMDIASVLRMERGLVRQCFAPRAGLGASSSQTVEGIRAQIIDKDRAPRWQPARVEDVQPEHWRAFFDNPWPVYAHPLRQWL